MNINTSVVCANLDVIVYKIVILLHGQIFWGLKIEGMVKRLCKKSAKKTLRPPCCRINYDARRVQKFIRQSRDAIHPMTSRQTYIYIFCIVSFTVIRAFESFKDFYVNYKD